MGCWPKCKKIWTETHRTWEIYVKVELGIRIWSIFNQWLKDYIQGYFLHLGKHMYTFCLKSIFMKSRCTYTHNTHFVHVNIHTVRIHNTLWLAEWILPATLLWDDCIWREPININDGHEKTHNRNRAWSAGTSPAPGGRGARREEEEEENTKPLCSVRGVGAEVHTPAAQRGPQTTKERFSKQGPAETRPDLTLNHRYKSSSQSGSTDFSSADWSQSRVVALVLDRLFSHVSRRSIGCVPL